MQGEPMKTELVIHEFHTNLVKTHFFFPFASAVIISCFYVENANGKKKYCSIVNFICLPEIIGWKKSACKNLVDYQELMFYLLHKYLTRI